MPSERKERTSRRVCPVCKREFSVSDFQMSKRYCSTKCRAEAKPASKPAVVKRETHLCTSCRVSQKDCERFSSGFKELPGGAEEKKVNGQVIVVKCPKYR